MGGAEAEIGSTPATVAAIFFFAGLSGLCADDLDGLDDFGGFCNLAVILVSTFCLWSIMTYTSTLGCHLGRGRHSITSLYFIALRLSRQRGRSVKTAFRHKPLTGNAPLPAGTRIPGQT